MIVHCWCSIDGHDKPHSARLGTEVWACEIDGWWSEVVYSKTNQKGALEGSKRQRRSVEVSGVPLSEVLDEQY
jgi:hypothetical protein